MTDALKKTIEEKVIEQLKTIYDPEIPVNLYDLGLIYELDPQVKDGKNICVIHMTLTSVFCAEAENIFNEVKAIADKIDEIEEIDAQLVFDPPWTKEKMSDEAKLELDMF